MPHAALGILESLFLIFTITQNINNKIPIFDEEIKVLDKVTK